jgi:Protein of unknown function (DUF1592)/Protein of unknown function (DUF1588)/Protein of unknown function (DUF1595)/Protein of unknown function (DUF1585)/Protein of unknown function (DUF1587)
MTRPLAARVVAVILLGAFFAWTSCQGRFSALGSAFLGSDSGTPNVDPLDKPCTVTPAPVLDAQRLTKNEYNNVIRDVFGVTGDFSALFAEPSKGAAGFTTESAAQTLTPTIVLEFYRAADAVTQTVFAQIPNPLLACTTAGDPPRAADGGLSVDPCTAKTINDLATLAFRRTPTDEEQQQLFSLYRSASSAQPVDGMKLVVSGILLSPQFLFRTSSVPSSSSEQIALTSSELASRLSFFLWGSIPDAALLKAASDGTLDTDEGLEAEVRRMLKSPKSAYLANFAKQWLELEKLDTQVRSQARFPTYTPETVESMKRETLDFMTNLVASDESVFDLIDGRYTFVDQRLANLYQIDAGFKEPTRISFTDNRRFGILTHASTMSMTSVGDATSPVRRGLFVLQKLLCSPPPPPPANVPALPEDHDAGTFLGESEIRQRLAKHRTFGPSCKGCHVAMDPIGLSFENYDAIGAYRSTYGNGTAIDSTGELPTGERLSSAADLVPILRADPRFGPCFTSQLSSFAHGRNTTTERDRCGIEALARQAVAPAKRFSDLVVAIVLDPTFRNRAAE